MREKIIFTLANICAEPNDTLKNKVVQRSSIIDFFDIMANNLEINLALHLPWVL
jgi:hypothetical protein